LISGNIVILATAAGLLILFVWLVYRISGYRKRSREIDDRAREISSMSAPPVVKKARSSPDRTVLETPSVGLLIVMHRDGISPTRGMFVSSVEKGRHGLIVTSEDPRSIPVPPTVKRIWMNRSSVKGEIENTMVVNPTNLSGTLDEIATFAAESGRSSVVLLDRFDDLITSNDLPRVVKFLNMLRERSAKDRMAILVPIGYRAVPQRVRNQLMEAFETVVV
jgi:hypothetical protein